MADVQDAGDEDDIQPRPPQLQQYIDYWQYWYNVVVNRGANVDPVVTYRYTVDLVTDDPRPAPFPLNISETWSCTMLIALIIAIYHGVDKGWLFEESYPYPLWAGRVLGRVLLTLGAAILSTLAFEVIGSVTSLQFLFLTQTIENWISRLLIRRFHWGEVDAAGEPLRDADGNFAWILDPTAKREFVRDTLQGLAVFALDYYATFFLELGSQLVQLCVDKIIGPGLHFLFAIPVGFIPTVLSSLFLPTPGFDSIQEPRELWFEYGVPIIIQFWVLVLLWLLRILFMSKAERLAMQGWPIVDPKMATIWQLLRATAMHFLAFTAYQLVCCCIVAMRSVLPQSSWYITVVDGPIVPFLGKIMPNGRIFAAALLLFFHWLLRIASIFVVRRAQQFWVPYILWQTRYSAVGATAYWQAFYDALVKDLALLDLSKRVTSRVAMTALFGLRSSWPARFHMGTVVADV
ncbi:hypothetical protein F5Y01DRAFT_311693 [Xylaria sp. FL0043]|nr:hypothetical protein F5Y01DRAFT_311693 [Xylaria sp. FL0043]